jgi:hypothetical protein
VFILSLEGLCPASTRALMSLGTRIASVISPRDRETPRNYTPPTVFTS